MNKKYLNFITPCFRKQKGLTLIEMLIAVAMLGIIIAATSGLFISSLNYNQKVLATQELIDQTSFSLEYMSRDLRMAKKDISKNCIPDGESYEITTNGIKFFSYNGDCTEFYLYVDGDGKRYAKKKITSPLPNAGEWNLLSDIFQIDFLKFNLSGGKPYNYQPKVTILLGVSGRLTRMLGRPKVQVQTTVSQRNLDF